MERTITLTGGFLLLALLACNVAKAQLEITEVMFDPNNENVWEWLEVRNSGAAAVDLNGVFGDHLGDNTLSTTASPNIDNTVADNTIIPAGGVAVLYDGFLNGGNSANFKDQVFRDAWSLPGSVPLIGVDFFPGLSNGGTAVGYWPDRAAYDLDQAAGVVDNFNHALFSIDYRTGFPAGNGAASMQWNGSGSNANGANWALSQSGIGGAVTSVPVSFSGPINSTNDLANPGIVPAGAAASGVLISEIMYDPASPENDWEWVEIYNNSGSAIDFSATNYVLDDDDNNPLSTANITSGSIANATAAILYNSDKITFQDAQDAWDPGGANGTNFIAVTDFTQFSNTSDTVALWASFADYTGETEQGPTPKRTTDNAVAAVTYDENDGWPITNGSAASIYLADLNSDPTVGFNWVQSLEGDSIGSFHASEALGTISVHAGGDIGSPGTFNTSTPSADFDHDGDVDGNDFLVWQRGFGAEFDATDLANWRSQFGSITATAAVGAVPEPASLVLFAFVLAATPLLAGRPRGN